MTAEELSGVGPTAFNSAVLNPIGSWPRLVRCRGRYLRIGEFLPRLVLMRIYNGSKWWLGPKIRQKKTTKVGLLRPR